MAERKGDWMFTASGRRFWPLDPRRDEVFIEDVAQHLANQGRFKGATKHYYSTAQHSVELCRWFLGRGDTANARWALLHDGGEAFSPFGDIIRPVKQDIRHITDPIDEPIERAVWDAVGLHGDLPAIVHDADKKIANDEMLALVPWDAIVREGIDKRPRLGIEIRPWFPTVAHDRFLSAYHELFSPVAA